MNSNCTNTYWHVAYTMPNFEKKICKELGKRAINSYLPLQKVLRQWKDRKKVIEVPLFPNYLFVKVNPIERCSVLNINGILKFVSFNGNPAIVNDFEINNIMRIINSSLDVHREVNCDLSVGEKVKITSGALEGLEGVVMEAQGNSRIYIEMRFISQTISVAIPKTNLKKHYAHEREYSYARALH